MSPVLGGVIVGEKKTNYDDRRKRVEFTGGVVCDNDENVRSKNPRNKKQTKKVYMFRVCVRYCVRFIPGEEFARTGTRWARDRSEYCKIEFSRTFLFLITLVRGATQ